MTKLDWDYDQHLGCEVAMHNGYRIKAVHDDCPENPFESWDCNWPIAVYYDRSLELYDKIKTGAALTDPISRFTDDLLVHDQKAIAEALDCDLTNHIENYFGWDDEAEAIKLRKWHTDATFLREAFENELSEQTEQNKLLDVYEALYKLLGIPCYKTTSRGYSQGDWAEVLVVATPEAQIEFGRTEVPESDLEATADLYSAWAWGDVFGYIIEKPVFDEDGDIEDWEDACDHNSCWGYYGDDHTKSGLEEAALECVPEEPVTLPDNVLEDAQ